MVTAIAMTERDRERFVAKVGGGPLDACWQWLAGVDGHGYGSFKLGSKRDRSNYMAKAHRIAFWLACPARGGGAFE